MAGPQYKAGSLGGSENLLGQFSRRGVLNRALAAALEADESAGEFDERDVVPDVLLMRARAHAVASGAFVHVLAAARDGDFGPDDIDLEAPSALPGLASLRTRGGLT